MIEFNLAHELRNQANEIASEGHVGWGNLDLMAADEIERLRAELAEATAWRPISTAPIEGRILLWRAHGTVPIIARYDPIYGEFEDEFGDHVYGGTHWMPLPAAPNEIDAAMAGGENGN